MKEYTHYIRFKATSKQAPNDACISFVERELARPKVKSVLAEKDDSEKNDEKDNAREKKENTEEEEILEKELEYLSDELLLLQQEETKLTTQYNFQTIVVSDRKKLNNIWLNVEK